jgi:transcriptional regulator with XRE-family HTH domain
MRSNIRQLRKERRISQKELGEALGMSQQVISRMERDRDKIQVDVLMHLADYFQVSTDCILGYQRIPEDISAEDAAEETTAASDRVAEIDRLEQMDQNQRVLLWNLLLNLKKML